MLQNREDVFNNSLNRIYEGAFKIGDTYKTKAIINVPKSLINAFVSKAKKQGIDPREMWSDTDLAEMFITYVTTHYLNNDSLPVEAILGEPDKSKEEVKTIITDDNEQDEQPVNTEVETELPLDNESDDIHGEVELTEEGLGAFFKGGTKEEIEAKKKELLAKLDEYIKKYPDLYFNGKELNKDELIKVMSKNNFLGTLKVLDGSLTKHKHPSISYKPGAKGLNKLAAGSGGTVNTNR